MRKQTFELRSIMKRIIEETESKIMSIRKKYPKKSEQLTKNDFFINPKYNIDFPVSRSTYDKYYTFARNKNARNGKGYGRNAGALWKPGAGRDPRYHPGRLYGTPQL